jgi:PKHD-type hydroxylase
MINYYIRKILDNDQINQIKLLIKESDENNYWSSGLLTGGGTLEIKNNLELNNSTIIQSINNVIMSSLDSDKKFIDFTIAGSSNLNIISKTMEGGYYNPHVDNWNNGEYSTTIFLNDPDEYEDGELCLYFGGDEETKIKLKSGWGITYSTGTIHRVNKVKSGTRYVSVFWTKSLIKDSFIRKIYSEISNIEHNICNYQNPFYISNCSSSIKDPLFCIENLKTEILRRYSHQ